MQRIQRQPQNLEENTYAWEKFLNENIKLRQLIFKIDNYQKFIYENNIMEIVDLILYNDKDSGEVQQYMEEHNQNNFQLLKDFSQKEITQFSHPLPSKDKRKKFFDCFKNQHQCQAGEKICLNKDCNQDRVMCQICQANHQECNKVIQIDKIIDLIQTADRKIFIQNTEIHLLINPKLPCQLKSQILSVFYNLQKSPNIKIFPKNDQKEFLNGLTMLNHQIDLLDQQLQQPPRQLQQNFNQDIQSQSIQDNSTDTDSSQGQCTHENKDTIKICFQCNLDPIFCERCDQLHANHVSQSKESFDEVIQFNKNNQKKLNKLIQTCRFLQVYKQELKSDNLSIKEVRKIKNKAKQVMNENDLKEVDFQIILDQFQKQNIQKQSTQTLQEKEKIIQQQQAEIIELKKKYEQTLNLREQNDSLTNKYKISQNKFNDLSEKYSMFENQITQLTQENKQLKNNDSRLIQTQQSQADQKQLQTKLQEQTRIITDQKQQIQLLKKDNENYQEKLQQYSQQLQLQQQKNFQEQQKSSQEQIKKLKQENENLNLQLEKFKQNNKQSQKKSIQENDNLQQETKIKQLSDELVKYKQNYRNQQIIDWPFYQQQKCRCGGNNITNICYYNLNENVLLCDQCAQDISQQCIFIFNFENQQEQVKISHLSQKYDKILQTQKELQIKNLQIYDPYQYLNTQQQLDQEQLHQVIQFVLAKDLLNYINIELKDKTGKLKDNIHNFIGQFVNFQQASLEFSNYCANQIQNVMRIICTPQIFIDQSEMELKKQCDQLEQSQIQLQFAEKILQQYFNRERIEQNLDLNQVSLQINQSISQGRGMENSLEQSLLNQQSLELLYFDKYCVSLRDKKDPFILKEKKDNYKINLQLNHPIRLDIQIDSKFTFYGLIIGNLVDNFTPDITIYIYCQKQQQQQKQPTKMYQEKLSLLYSKDFQFIKLLLKQPQIFEQYDQIAIYLNMSSRCSFQLYKTSIRNNYFTVKNDQQFSIDSFVGTTSQKQEEGLIASLIIADN